MKILHLLPSLKRRGAQIFVRDLIYALAERDDIEQLLVVFTSGVDEVGMKDVFGRVEFLPDGNSLGKIIALRSAIHVIRPDIIFSHGAEPLKFGVLACGTGIRPKIIYRKIGLSEQWLGRYRWLKLPFQRWLISRADLILAVGKTMRQEVIDLFRAVPNKIRVVYQGFDHIQFALPEGTRERTRNALGIALNSKVLISVGTLAWEKNQASMIQVLAKVRQSYSNVVLVLVGDGPERRKLENLTYDLDMTDAVKFLGLRNDVPKLLTASDIFLLTSLTEGVPGVLIEAGMAGLPCVTWNVAGAREVVKNKESGLVTPYKDESAFVAAVINLLEDQNLCEQMGTVAQSFCQKRFNMKHCSSEHVKLFKCILSRHG